MAAFLAEMKAENPRNDYAATEDGIAVTAAKETRIVTLNCTDRQFNEIINFIDNIGCFYVVKE